MTWIIVSWNCLYFAEIFPSLKNFHVDIDRRNTSTFRRVWLFGVENISIAIMAARELQFIEGRILCSKELIMSDIRYLVKPFLSPSIIPGREDPANFRAHLLVKRWMWQINKKLSPGLYRALVQKITQTVLYCYWTKMGLCCLNNMHVTLLYPKGSVPIPVTLLGLLSSTWLYYAVIPLDLEVYAEDKGWIILYCQSRIWETSFELLCSSEVHSQLWKISPQTKPWTQSRSFAASKVALLSTNWKPAPLYNKREDVIEFPKHMQMYSTKQVRTHDMIFKFHKFPCGRELHLLWFQASSTVLLWCS